MGTMDRVIALVNQGFPAPIQELQFELLRASIVCSCAFALIAAGRALPF
jgi:hypothetical protein